MKNLLVFLKKYRKESILAPLFKLLESAMDLFVPLVVASIINDGIAGGSRGLIFRNFLILIALAILGMVFSFTAQWMAAKASTGFAADLRQALFDHVQKLSYRELDSLGTDTLITRMTSDVNQIQNGLNLALRLLLRSPFIVFGAMIMAFTIDFRCACIFAGAIPMLGIAVFAIMLLSIPLFAKVQEALDRLLGLTRENLTGVRVIRAFCKEHQEIDEFDRRNALVTRMNETVGRLSALMNPATYLIINVATIILIRQGALRVQIGALQQGDVVALYNYMAQIVVELVKLASLIITIDRSLACAKRAQAILATEPSIKYPDAAGQSATDKAASSTAQAAAGQAAAAASSTGSLDTNHSNHIEKDNPAGEAVRFRDVSFSYSESGDAALSDIDFVVKKGQTVGIIGGTGSGKTSVVQLIARFYDATEGSVEVDGRNVREYPEGMLTEKIGIVPQKAVLFEGSIRDNLCWGKNDATDEELWEAINAAQAREVVLGKEGELEAQVEQGGRNFSGGQRQRLTIARALVKRPEILILDDSASALDLATDLKLRRAIAALPGDMTVFIVSQRTSGVRDADRILVLDDGRLAGNGTHDELMKTCEVYQEIYYSQYPEERPRSGAKIPTAGTGKEVFA
ncbi:MAG: ABC transporter ATP-binding protein [Lachnospiraceae bacterium]|nr:ABC transporter ATP-binding protein [Lachnospiraceae bacterium]